MSFAFGKCCEVFAGYFDLVGVSQPGSVGNDVIIEGESVTVSSNPNSTDLTTELVPPISGTIPGSGYSLGDASATVGSSRCWVGLSSSTTTGSAIVRFDYATLSADSIVDVPLNVDGANVSMIRAAANPGAAPGGGLIGSSHPYAAMPFIAGVDKDKAYSGGFASSTVFSAVPSDDLKFLQRRFDNGNPLGYGVAAVGPIGIDIASNGVVTVEATPSGYTSNHIGGMISQVDRQFPGAILTGSRNTLPYSMASSNDAFVFQVAHQNVTKCAGTAVSLSNFSNTATQGNPIGVCSADVTVEVWEGTFDPIVGPEMTKGRLLTSKTVAVSEGAYEVLDWSASYDDGPDATTQAFADASQMLSIFRAKPDEILYILSHGCNDNGDTATVVRDTVWPTPSPNLSFIAELYLNGTLYKTYNRGSGFVLDRVDVIDPANSGEMTFCIWETDENAGTRRFLGLDASKAVMIDVVEPDSNFTPGSPGTPNHVVLGRIASDWIHLSTDGERRFIRSAAINNVNGFDYSKVTEPAWEIAPLDFGDPVPESWKP